MSMNCVFKRRMAGVGVLFMCITGYCFASAYVGVVKDKKNGYPVENVRVSLGYTDFVTHTDKSGRFTLPYELAVVNKGRVHSSEKFEMFWKHGNAILDFSSAPSTRKVMIFSLNGKCIYQKNISKEKPLISIPWFAHGIYLMKLEANSSMVSSFKINTAAQNRLTGRFMTGSIRDAAASVSELTTEALLFQHDSYYPQSADLQSEGMEYSIEMKPDPRAALFNEANIYTYNFTISKEDSLIMERDALLENYVPAQFTFNDSVIGQIGIRYKGSNYSLPNCFDTIGTRADKQVCRKISFKLKFNEYIDDQKFYSLKHINLHSMSADGTKMHDILSYDLFRDMGIAAPRTAYVKVNINGVFQGVFLAVEAIDGRFTASRWPEDPDGNLFKERWPMNNIPDYYKEGLETNEDSGNGKKMVKFFKAISKSNESSFVDSVSKYMDMKYFLRYIAVDRAIHNADGIMTWYKDGSWMGNHNYYFYEEAAIDGKYWLIPWDLHVTFSKTDPIVDDAGAPEWNVKTENCEPVKIWGGDMAIPAHCDKLTGFTADLLWNDYVKICENMLKNEFSVLKLTSKIDSLQKLLDKIIPDDPYVNYDSWTRSVKALRKDITTLNSSYDDYINKRAFTADTSGFLQPFTGTGYIETDKLNNFEFLQSSADYKWANTSSSVNTTASIAHNTTSPLWGTADLCYSFSFNNSPDTGTYREWSMGILSFDTAKDISKLKEIHINLKGNLYRNVSVFIESPVYSKNGIETKYGWDIPCGVSDSVRVFRISDASYPDWETGNLPDLLDKVLSEATGIGFFPRARFDDSGKLSVVPDTGYLQIDNIRFIYE